MKEEWGSRLANRASTLYSHVICKPNVFRLLDYSRSAKRSSNFFLFSSVMLLSNKKVSIDYSHLPADNHTTAWLPSRGDILSLSLWLWDSCSTLYRVLSYSKQWNESRSSYWLILACLLLAIHAQRCQRLAATTEDILYMLRRFILKVQVANAASQSRVRFERMNEVSPPLPLTKCEAKWQVLSSIHVSAKLIHGLKTLWLKRKRQSRQTEVEASWFSVLTWCTCPCPRSAAASSCWYFARVTIDVSSQSSMSCMLSAISQQQCPQYSFFKEELTDNFEENKWISEKHNVSSSLQMMKNLLYKQRFYSKHRLIKL